MKLKLTRVQEILKILSAQTDPEALKAALDKYHPSDISDALQELDAPARRSVYALFDMDWLSEVFTYLDNVSVYLAELSPEQAVILLKNMDADDAIDVLENIDDAAYRDRLIRLLDEKSSADIRFIASFPEDSVGHMMTTNFITIPDGIGVKEAMREVIRQAPENDNINIIYVLDGNGVYAGAITLKNLIIAREHTLLDEIVKRNYPSVFAEDKVSDIIEQLKDYSEDSIPVLDASRRIVGIVTSDDIVEAVEQEMSEDYAKLAGLTAEEDLHERLRDQRPASGRPLLCLRGPLPAFFQGNDVFRRVHGGRVRRARAVPRHGRFQSCGHGDPHVLSQNACGPRRCLRPADYHGERPRRGRRVLRPCGSIPPALCRVSGAGMQSCVPRSGLSRR